MSRTVPSCESVSIFGASSKLVEGESLCPSTVWRVFEYG